MIEIRIYFQNLFVLVKLETNHIIQDSLLLTDEEKSYKVLKIYIKLKQFKSGISTDKILHIQHINSFHSGLKNWLVHFKGVTTKFLNNYITYFINFVRNRTFNIIESIVNVNNMCKYSDIQTKKFILNKNLPV